MLNKAEMTTPTMPPDQCDSAQSGQMNVVVRTTDGKVRVPLVVRRTSACANRFASVGVPLPPGLVSDTAEWVSEHEFGPATACQTSITSRWPDGSARWILATFGVSPEPLDANCAALQVTSSGDGGFLVKTGVATFWVGAGGGKLLEKVPDGNVQELATSGISLSVRDLGGADHEATIERVVVERTGALESVLQASGRVGRAKPLLFTTRIGLQAGSSQVRLECTVHNPRRAQHAGGFWDLGDAASVPIHQMTLSMNLARRTSGEVRWRATRDGREQASSTGERFEIRSDGLAEQLDPIVAIIGKDNYVACTVAEFCQRGPNAMVIGNDGLDIVMFASDGGEPAELQPGEQLTRVVWMDFGRLGHDSWDSLARTIDPPEALVDPEWIKRCRVLPFIPRPDGPSRESAVRLYDAACEGNTGFPAKRQQLGEYGWRNYGDMWADHEQTYSPDPLPLVSHYNNQYDLLYGLLVQYVLTGKSDWWKLADPLARHVLDIDIYHTDRDKSGYCGGLFWHTAHYLDAGDATHRSMSRKMLGKSIPVSGGGPGNEHNYASGLALYACLTGDARARDAVLGLANWVIDMDDGRLHLLGVASDAPTGHASATSQPDYHGPGRGAGNSINCLVDAWLLSLDKRYLQKADELIRRTIHPRDDVAARQLDNYELRWSYTVHLQALCRFLELVPRECVAADLHPYIRASVLHYAQWMAERERCYLDTPEKLEYPTETWAAQDLRKGNVLLLAARLTARPERERFIQRGREILDRAWSQLMSFPTRTYTRPLAIVLQQGYIETFLSENPEPGPWAALDDQPEPDFGQPVEFIPQKQLVKRMLRSPAAYPRLAWNMLNVTRWWNVWRRSWWAERLRIMLGRV